MRLTKEGLQRGLHSGVKASDGGVPRTRNSGIVTFALGH